MVLLIYNACGLLPEIQRLKGDFFMHLEQFKSLCKGITAEHGTTFKCKCPNHDDKKSSLSVTGLTDRIVIHCHAGCSTQDILKAMNLSMKDLFYNQINTSVVAKIKYVNKNKECKELSYGPGNFVEDIYDYYDDNNNYIFSKLRFQPKGEKKSLVYAVKRGDTYYAGKPNEVEAKALFNKNNFLEAIAKGEIVYLVEGEKDVRNLATIGIVATTAGSVTNWDKSFTKYFIGAEVVIIADNDKVGLEKAKQIQEDLRIAAHATKLITVSEKEHGDVSDYLETLGNIKPELKKKELTEFVNSTGSWVYAYWVHAEFQKKGSMKISINPSILADTLKQTMHYLIVKNEGIGTQFLYVYEHGVYTLVEKFEFQYFIKRYIPIRFRKVSIMNEVYGLLTMERADCNSDQLDLDESIINCTNGILHIDTMTLTPHNPKYKTTIQIPFAFESDINKCVNNGVFDKYLDFLTSGNADTKQLLLEAVGLCLSNVYGYRTKKTLFMCGAGNSGKSQLKALITELIGNRYVAPITLERLNKPFGISAIYCKRLIGANDLPYAKLEELNVLKELTGGDPVDVEFKNKNNFSWKFKGFSWFTMNDLPKFGGDKGPWVYERIMVVQCNNVVPENERDAKLVDKMLEEGQYIIHLAIKHLKGLIDNGYKFHETVEVKEAREAYRIMNDSFLEFMDHCKTTDDKKVMKRSDLWRTYTEWCKLNKRGANKQKECFAVLEEQRLIYIGKIDRQIYVRNVEMKREFMDFPEQEELPF